MDWACSLGGPQVFKGTLRGETEVAIKVLAVQTAEERKRFLTETAVLHSCAGPYIVQVSAPLAHFKRCICHLPGLVNDNLLFLKGHRQHEDFAGYSPV
jgi:hypothetical protein